MADVSFDEIQQLAPQKQTLPGVLSDVSLDDMQKIGASNEIQYTPPKPEVSIGERLASDVVKPFAEVPHTIGAGLYWLGSDIKDETPFGALGDRIARAGLVMKERNDNYVANNFAKFTPNMMDDILSGGSMVAAAAAGVGLAALLGAPAAATATVTGVGLATGTAASVGAEMFGKFKEQGKSTPEADRLALMIGAPAGGAMALGMGTFLSGTGNWFKRMIGSAISNAAIGSGSAAVTGTLELATGAVPYDGIDSLKDVMSQAVHDGVVWGVLGGATAVPLALKQHSAVVEGFEKMGFEPKEAQQKANDIMGQTAHVAMDFVEHKLDYTPNEKDRIQIPALGNIEGKLRPDILDRDFIPKAIQPAEPKVQELQDTVRRLEVVKKDITDLGTHIADLNAQKEDIENQNIKRLADIKKGIAVGEPLDTFEIAKLEQAQQQMAELRLKADVFKTQIEALKEQLKPKTDTLSDAKIQLQKLKQGFRQGRIQTKDEIKQVQSQVVDLVKGADLEAKDKAKFLSTVKNIQTSEQLQNALPEIEAKVQRLGEMQDEREWVKNLKEVKTKVVDKLPVEYQDALKPVLASFDLAKRSKSVILNRAKTLEFFRNKLSENEPLTNDEQNALNVAATKSLSEMSHEEIRNLHDTVMKVVQQGKLKNKYLTNLDARTHEERIKKFLTDLTGDPFKEALNNFDRNSVEQNKPIQQRLFDMVRRLNDGLTGPEFMMKWSQLPDVFQSMHEGFQNKIEYQQRYMKDLEQIHKGVDFAKVMADAVEIPELGLTGDKAPRVNDLMRLYAQSFDEGGRRHLENTIPPKELDKLLSHFEKAYPTEAKAILKMFDYFKNVVGPQVDDVVVKTQGHHMQQVDFYDPIGSSLEDRSGEEMKHELNLGSKGMAGRATTPSGFTKSRVESKLAFRKFDYYGNLVRHLSDVANFRAMAEAMHDANKVLYDPRVTKALRDKFGPEWVPMLHKWLKDSAMDGHQYDSYFARLAANLRRNFVMAKIAFNPLSAAKVYAQMGVVADHVGTKWVTPAVRDYSMNTKYWDEFIDKNSLQMKNRYFMQERELADLIQNKGVGALGDPKLSRKSLELGMAMHQLTDKQVTRWTWVAAYRKEMALNDLLGGTQEDAFKAADQAVRLTHPQGGTLYLPDAFRGPEVQKAFSTFLNAPNKVFNVFRQDILDFKEGRKSAKDLAVSLALSGFIPAVWLATMAMRRIPSPKEIAEETVNQTLGSEMYVGFLTRALIMHSDVAATTPWAAPFADFGHMVQRKDKIRYGLATADDILGTGTSNIYRMISGQMFKPVKETK